MTHPPSRADIAAQLEAYDPQALPANEVLNFLDHLVTPVQDSESVDIFSALGRITAQDVISPIHVPPHDTRRKVCLVKTMLPRHAFVSAIPAIRKSATSNSLGTRGLNHRSLVICPPEPVASSAFLALLAYSHSPVMTGISTIESTSLPRRQRRSRSSLSVMKSPAVKPTRRSFILAVPCSRRLAFCPC